MSWEPPDPSSAWLSKLAQLLCQPPHANPPILQPPVWFVSLCIWSGFTPCLEWEHIIFILGESLSAIEIQLRHHFLPILPHFLTNPHHHWKDRSSWPSVYSWFTIHIFSCCTQIVIQVSPTVHLKTTSQADGNKGKRMQEEKHLISSQNWGRGRVEKSRAKHK